MISDDLQYVPRRIAAAPVAALVQELGVPIEQIAQRCAARSPTRSADSWRRWLHHLPHRREVVFWWVDELCVAYGRHLYEVDPLYRQDEEAA